MLMCVYVVHVYMSVYVVYVDLHLCGVCGYARVYVWYMHVDVYVCVVYV